MIRLSILTVSVLQVAGTSSGREGQPPGTTVDMLPSGNAVNTAATASALALILRGRNNCIPQIVDDSKSADVHQGTSSSTRSGNQRVGVLFVHQRLIPMHCSPHEIFTDWAATRNLLMFRQRLVISKQGKRESISDLLNISAVQSPISPPRSSSTYMYVSSAPLRRQPQFSKRNLLC